MKRLSLMVVVATGVALAACNKVNFSKMPQAGCQGFTQDCLTVDGIDHFDYDFQTAAPNIKTDILIVDDNSGSMAAEQQHMADRFPTFLNSLATLDWRIGIVTTDMAGTGPTQDGQLLQFTGSPGTYFLTKSTPSASSLFQNTIQRPETGSGDERGVYAGIRALDRRAERGFIRDNAHLAIVVLSDENERSKGGTLSGYPLEEGRDYPQNLIDYVNGTWNFQKTLTVHSIIIRPGDSSCLSIQTAQSMNTASEGTIYADLSTRTGGVIGDICANDYGSQLEAIGNVAVQTTASVTLACEPIAGTLQVSAPSQWTLSGNKILFNPALPGGTTIHLKYQCVARK